MAAGLQVPPEFAVSAADIKNSSLSGDLLDGFQNAQLKALACGRKLACEGLVKLTIELDQSVKGFRIHDDVIIIAGLSIRKVKVVNFGDRCG